MKRIAIKLVVFLLLGAVVNVAVAWACAAWVDHPRQLEDLNQGMGVDDLDDPQWWVSMWWDVGSLQQFSKTWSTVPPEMRQIMLDAFKQGWELNSKLNTTHLVGISAAQNCTNLHVNQKASSALTPLTACEGRCSSR